MQVEDGLAAVGAIVQEQAIAVVEAELLGQLARDVDHMADEALVLGAEVLDHVDRLLVDDQDLHRRAG